jgi:hypothetical protein
VGSVGVEDRMKVEIYKQLFRLNKGFDEILTALAALRQHPAFPASELDRFTAVSKETRASTNSFLTAIIQHLYRKPTVPSSTLGGYVIRGIAGTTVVF